MEGTPIITKTNTTNRTNLNTPAPCTCPSTSSRVISHDGDCKHYVNEKLQKVDGHTKPHNPKRNKNNMKRTRKGAAQSKHKEKADDEDTAEDKT
jgi:hypothetical protein